MGTKQEKIYPEPAVLVGSYEHVQVMQQEISIRQEISNLRHDVKGLTQKIFEVHALLEATLKNQELILSRVTHEEYSAKKEKD